MKSDRKVIVFDPEECVGCRYCEIACSIKHEDVSNPLASRIKILKRFEEVFIPIRCRQCDEPVCVTVCPVGALTIDRLLKIIRISYDKCKGCRMCVELCPYGGMHILPVLTGKARVIACDLCEGDPHCVKVCSGGALLYVEESEISYKLRREKILGHT